MSDTAQVARDELQVIRTINQLFLGTDKREWAQVKQLFSSEVLFDMSSMTGGSPTTMNPQQIVDGWDAGLRGLSAIHHQSGNFIVDVTDLSATASCYGIAIHYLPNPSNENTRTFVGSYDFGLVRVGQEWKINKFRFTLKFIDGNRELK